MGGGELCDAVDVGLRWGGAEGEGVGVPDDEVCVCEGEGKSCDTEVSSRLLRTDDS